MRKKIMSLKTDSTPVDAPKPVENSTILALYKLVADPADYAQMESDFRAGGVGYGDFKKRLFAALWEYFAPMRQRKREILADPGYVEVVLRDGRERANQVAESVMSRVRSATGLIDKSRCPRGASRADVPMPQSRDAGSRPCARQRVGWRIELVDWNSSAAPPDPYTIKLRGAEDWQQAP